MALLKSSGADGCDYLFSGSRDGTLKRWALMEDAATCSTTFESHVDWVPSIYLGYFYCEGRNGTNKTTEIQHLKVPMGQGRKGERENKGRYEDILNLTNSG